MRKPISVNREAYREWKSWTANRFGEVNEVQALEFWTELKLAGVPIGAKLRTLEIGFGNGAFASWAVSQGWIFVGIEADQELVDRAVAKGWEAHHAEESLATIVANREFDLIVAFDVLEHLTHHEILSFLESIASALAPSGKFIARIPSGDSPFARSIQYADITHRSITGSGIVHQLAQQAGLNVVEIRAPAFPIFGLGAKRAVRRMGVAVLRAVVTYIVNVAFHDNQRRVVAPNMVIILQLPNPPTAMRTSG